MEIESLSKCIVSDEKTIFEILKVINESKYRIALIVNSKDKFIGTVTDGDVRRGLVNSISLEDNIRKIMNVNPFYVGEDVPDNTIFSEMIKRSILQVPVINSQGKIIDLKLKDNLEENMLPKQESTRDVWVILMLGGLGSRLHPLTQDVPKPMIKVGDKPLLEIILSNFFKQGFRKFIFSVNYKSDVIESYFKNGEQFGVDIQYVYENKRMGTAGSLSLLEQRPSGPFLVMNGDLLTSISFLDLVDFHNQNNVMATMCVREYTHEIPYGIVKNTGVELDEIVEKPSQTYFVNAGIYALSPDVLDLIPEDQFYDMPMLFERINKEGGNSVVFPIHEYWIDIGNINDLEKARQEYRDIFEN